MRGSSLLTAACLALGAGACAAIQTDPNASVTAAAIQSDNAYFTAGQETLAQRKLQRERNGPAKNVILFIGDGMDIATVTAARILEGQRAGGDGEANALSFEALPFTGLAKTYTTDFQVSDSAGTATAMLSGVKTRSGVVGVDGDALRGDCASALGAEVPTMAEIAVAAGRSIGIVTTTEITHATPASAYAHAADRNWAADADMPEEARAAGCKDIAAQLLDFADGAGPDVVFGGGRRNFMSAMANDPEYPEVKGKRADGRDLAREWIEKSDQHRYVWSKADFDAAADAPKLMALFEPGHMQFEEDRRDADGAGEPSLAEMTAKAIRILSQNEDGYFLLVEGGRIDHAHHGGNARRALADAIALSDAVAVARDMTSEDETLLIVTADHGHTLTIQGYPPKGADILGFAASAAPGDGKPYTTLGYANGPGSVFGDDIDLSEGRPAPRLDAVTGLNYRQQALIPTGAETHGGQDVPVYAAGPNAHLLVGAYEQNYIFHVILDAYGFGYP